MAVEYSKLLQSIHGKYEYLCHSENLVDKNNTEKHLFLDEWRRLMNENPVQMKEQTWTREELHGR